MSIRPVKHRVTAAPAIEGAGVHLRRAFGFGDTDEYDPFLLLDDFRNDVPDDYLKGFPWHPHRGIETITYVLAGTVDHADSLGNAGAIGPGDVQWMTAGRGIVHQEMPHGDATGRMHGFQLWANLPAAQKMTAPRYQEVASPGITEVTDDDGTRVRVICGEFWGRQGPVEGVAAQPQYLDIWVPPKRRAVASGGPFEKRLRLCVPGRRPVPGRVGAGRRGHRYRRRGPDARRRLGDPGADVANRVAHGV